MASPEPQINEIDNNNSACCTTAMCPICLDEMKSNQEALPQEQNESTDNAPVNNLLITGGAGGDLAMGCSHTFHLACITQNREACGGISHDMNCPMCRALWPAPITLYDQGCNEFVALMQNETIENGFWQPNTEEKKEKMAIIVRKWISSALQGYSNAQFILGRIYSLASGVVADKDKAIYNYQKAGEQGHLEAYYSIGVMYFEGCRAIPEKDLGKGLEWLEKAAEIGSENALRYLADIYLNGKEGIEIDLEKAFKYNESAAQKNNAKAQCQLAKMYYQGIHVKQDYKSAFLWYEKAAKQNIPQALFAVGSMYCIGKGVKKNFVLAKKYIEQAAEFDFHLARYKIGCMYYSGEGVEKNYAVAASYFMNLANKNYADAQLMLGKLYEHGHGVEKNQDEAMSWYLKAVALGSVEAIVRIAALHRDRKNYQEAINYYQMAILKNNATAEEQLATMYYNGQGVEKDTVQAIALYQSSAQKGNAVALYHLGQMYYYGLVNQTIDYKNALDCFNQGAKKGNSSSMLRLANMYDKGLYVQKDVYQAIAWYKKAADLNNLSAQLALADIYLSKRKPKDAFSLYEKAAIQKNPQALFNLGNLYRYGRGCEKNISKAISSFEEAAFNEYHEAPFALGKLYADLKEYDKASEWFLKAAVKGDSRAQYCLADLMLERNMKKEEAIHWLTKSANQNNPDALKLLKKLNVHQDINDKIEFSSSSTQIPRKNKHKAEDETKLTTLNQQKITSTSSAGFGVFSPIGSLNVQRQESKRLNGDANKSDNDKTKRIKP